jgi:hypothetical protein
MHAIVVDPLGCRQLGTLRHTHACMRLLWSQSQLNMFYIHLVAVHLVPCGIHMHACGCCGHCVSKACCGSSWWPSTWCHVCAPCVIVCECVRMACCGSTEWSSTWCPAADTRHACMRWGHCANVCRRLSAHGNQHKPMPSTYPRQRSLVNNFQHKFQAFELLSNKGSSL